MSWDDRLFTVIDDMGELREFEAGLSGFVPRRGERLRRTTKQFRKPTSGRCGGHPRDVVCSKCPRGVAEFWSERDKARCRELKCTAKTRREKCPLHGWDGAA